MKRALRNLLVAFAMVVVLGVASWLLFSLPERIVDAKGMTPSQYASALIDERRTVLAAFAALGAAVGLYFRYRRHQLDRDANATGRYMQAVEQLAHEHVAVRLGGLYALERIAQDSPRDASTVQEVISAHARRGKGLWASGDASDVATEMTAAVRILGRSSKFKSVDLSDCDLHGLDLSGLQLTEARFGHTNLSGTHLSDSDLRGAEMMGCDLSKAWLDGADLRGAILNQAILRGVLLEGVRLTDAAMQSADLRGAFVIAADLAGVDLRGATTEDDEQLVAVAKAGGSIEMPVALVKEHWDELNFEIERPPESDFAQYGNSRIFMNFENLPRWAEHRKMPRGLQLMAAFDLDELPPFVTNSEAEEGGVEWIDSGDPQNQS